MPTRRAKRARSIPRVTFARLVKEITEKRLPGTKWSVAALNGLHEEAEQFLSERFDGARDLAMRFGHRTISLKHFGGALAADGDVDEGASSEEGDVEGAGVEV